MFSVLLLDHDGWNKWKNFDDFNQAFIEVCEFLASEEAIGADMKYNQSGRITYEGVQICTIPRDGAATLIEYSES